MIDDGVARGWPGLVDEITSYAHAHRTRLQLAAAPVTVAGGEGAKNDPDAVTRLQTRFHEAGLDRHSFVLIVGGGAVLDMVGYAAATTHRGLRVVRLPTTVLGQNDSGVGVKNGVNAFGTKNLLGTFAPPFAVINDRRFLETLSPRDLISGMAEAVKVALIRDRAFFEWLEANAARIAAFEDDAGRPTRSAAAPSCTSPTSRARAIPFEAGSARPLDFGHWAAHKLETLTGHAPAPRRGGRHRHRPRFPLLRWRRVCSTKARRAASAPSSKGSGSRSGTTPSTQTDSAGALAGPARPRRVPRAPRRRAEPHPARARSAMGSRCTRSSRRHFAVPSTGCGPAPAAHEPRGRPLRPSHLLHEHSSRRDLARGAQQTSRLTSCG